MIPFSGFERPSAANAYRRAVRRYQFSHGVKYVCYGLVLPGRLKAYLPVDSPPTAANDRAFRAAYVYSYVFLRAYHFPCLHSFNRFQQCFVSFSVSTLSSFFATTDA